MQKLGYSTCRFLRDAAHAANTALPISLWPRLRATRLTPQPTLRRLLRTIPRDVGICRNVEALQLQGVLRSVTLPALLLERTYQTVDGKNPPRDSGQTCSNACLILELQGRHRRPSHSKGDLAPHSLGGEEILSS